jgi:peptidoglycan/xylan/chitin deacetylase (PgdA/CDA1 family)
MPSERKKKMSFLRRLRNPLIVAPAVVAVLAGGWIAWSGAAPASIAEANPGKNLFPSMSAAADRMGGWTAEQSGQAKVALKVVDGHVTNRALKLQVTEYNSGDVTLTSPRVPVQSDHTYFFKAYAASSTAVTVLARRYRPDGSSTLEELRDRPVQQDSWITVSDAFASGSTTTAVQYVFRLASWGSLQVDGAYLEAAEDVSVPPAPPTGPNLIPNPTLSGSKPAAPDLWSTYQSGQSAVTSSRGTDAHGSFLTTRIQKYTSGEAKWQYPPIPVTPDRSYRFTATYQSDRKVDVVAEFELPGDGRQFRNLETLPTAGAWTTISETFQVPQDATKAMVTLVAHGNGATSVRDYSLIDVTRPGPLRWTKPLVSLTFDDGWQSLYDQARPVLQSHNFRGTFYVNPGTIETPGFMTGEELQAMHKAGNEIGAHGYLHDDLTTISAGRVDDSLRKTRDELAAAGLATADLATPFGRSDPQVDWYASRYFTTVRGTDGGINTRQNLDPRNLKTFYVDDQTTSDDLAAALDETARTHGWLILVYHQIVGAGAGGVGRTSISRDVFAAQLDQIRDSGIAVAPVSNAFAQLERS